MRMNRMALLFLVGIIFCFTRPIKAQGDHTIRCPNQAIVNDAQEGVAYLIGCGATGEPPYNINLISSKSSDPNVTFEFPNIYDPDFYVAVWFYHEIQADFCATGTAYYANNQHISIEACFYGNQERGPW